MLSTYNAIPPMAGAQIDGFYTDSFSEAPARRDPDKVGGQFEAIFYRMLLEQARFNEEDNDPLFGSSQMSQAMTMFNDELANVMGSKGELGIGKMLLAEAEQKDTAN